MSAACAFHLAPEPVVRPWGGTRIAERFGWAPPSAPRGTAVGEWWLASCHASAPSRLRDRPLAFADWLRREGAALHCPAPESFPLLVKFLDARDVLSVQVHPDDEVARRQGLARGKTEAWFVVEADADSCVYLGTAAGTRCAELLARVAAGAPDGEVERLLRRVPVGVGDALLVPAGTVHAIGPGVTLFEIQQNSDTTWRIHDWGRGRPVHLDRASQACRDHAPEGVRRAPDVDDAWNALIRCRAFTLGHARVRSEVALQPVGRWAILTVLAGRGTLRAGADELHLAAGDTVFTVGSARVAGRDLELLAVEAP